MTTATTWDAALHELLDRGERSGALRPHCEAVALVIERLRADPRIGAVELQVSHATLVIGSAGAKRRVGIGWDGTHGYEVFFVDPGFEFIDFTIAKNADVVETVIRYLDCARGPIA
jgi:hypothetical protein